MNLFGSNLIKQGIRHTNKAMPFKLNTNLDLEEYEDPKCGCIKFRKKKLKNISDGSNVEIQSKQIRPEEKVSISEPTKSKK